MHFIQQVSRIVTRRAAAYLAVCIHALWKLRNSTEGISPTSSEPLSIGCNGSVIEKYPRFRQMTQEYLDQLTAISGARPGVVTLECAIESTIFGAAVAVCCAQKEGEEKDGKAS
jgi:hexokinase